MSLAIIIAAGALALALVVSAPLARVVAALAQVL